MSIVCTALSDERVMCNGTVYKAEEKILSYCDKEFWIYIGVYAGLVLFAGLTSGLTIGYFSLDMTTLKTMKDGGTKNEKKYASTILPLLERHHLLLVTLLLSCAAAEESMPIFLDKLVNPIFAIIISVVSVLIFAEVIPQSITTKYGLAIGATLAPLVYFLMAITFVVTWPIAKLLDCLLGSDHGTYYKRSQLKVLLDLHGDDQYVENPLTEQEIKIIKNTLDMQTKTTEDVMLPIDDVFMLDIDHILNKNTLKLLQEVSFSRIPVYEGNRNNIVTVLLTKTLIYIDPNQNIPVRTLISSNATRNVITVNPDQPLFEILFELKGPRGHLAFVKEPDQSYSVKPEIYRGGQFYCWRKPEYPEKTTELPQITDKLYNIMMYRALILGIITLEDIIEDLIQEEIVDETDVYVNIRSKLQVAKTKRASISLVIDNHTRNKNHGHISTQTIKRNYRSVSLPYLDVEPFYKPPDKRKSVSTKGRPSIHDIAESEDECSPLIN